MGVWVTDENVRFSLKTKKRKRQNREQSDADLSSMP
jgi:hypothetical protein